LVTLPSAAIAGSISVINAKPFVDTWSGIDEDDTGRAARFRFVITASGGVTVCLIDGGPYHVQATNLEFKGSTISFELPGLSVIVRGTLAERDSLEATILGQGKRETVQMVRGDRYPLKFSKLPPGPMTAERLRRLLLLSEAPAMGVDWAFKHGGHTVLVDGVRSLGATARVERTDAWHIGSDTKSMTATLVARLIEAGHLQWTTTVGDLLAQAIPTIRAEYQQATLIDLSYLLTNGGPSRVGSVFGTIELAGDQLTIPNQDGFRFRDGSNLFERPPPHALGNFRQSRSLRLSQGNSHGQM
jgi:hypothetical protein